MADRGRKRGAASPAGELDLLAIRQKAGVAQEQLNALNPYFDELKAAIHLAWEKLSPDQVEEAQVFKHQLYAVNKLIQIMELKVTKGKQANKRLEEYHVIN